MNGQGISYGLLKDVWLHICREGGKWTPEEIAQHVGEPREKVARLMHNMTRRGSQLRRYKADNGRAQFGVTAECVIPAGLTVKELASAGIVGVSEPKPVAEMAE